MTAGVESHVAQPGTPRSRRPRGRENGCAVTRAAMRCALALLCLAVGIGAIERDDEYQKYAMNFWQDREPDERQEAVGEWLEKGKSFGCVLTH